MRRTAAGWMFVIFLALTAAVSAGGAQGLASQGPYQTNVCPPGQLHQSGPGGPCLPTPPPPPKQCPDGSAVPAGQICPPQTGRGIVIEEAAWFGAILGATG
ncbi:hypothetical protein M2272_003009 [Mycobacterium frederiksbergense]|uniref:Intersectin-EH binding protein Ibp1 n=1 Tax=Mycolicibacterium frederiksbergense TaxID=117567 RepID=A0ABT6L1A4_9MYCO|nr:hypothetical protein [Mycolicibacterium frederiksbergense]MDH6196366.1 hypothetical protein [Mycolicibacterium frederiksbergense]